MHVWNVLHAARWKYRTQKIGHFDTIAQLCQAISSQLRHVSTTEKNVKQQYVPQMSLQYGELWPTSGWNLLASLGHPCKFQRVSHLGSVTARQSSSQRQPNFVVLNRGRHLYSAGRPSRWALAHISSIDISTWWHVNDRWRELVYLQRAAGSNEQTERLRDEWGHRHQHEEHHEAYKVARLIRHPVDDTAVDQRKYDLQRSTDNHRTSGAIWRLLIQHGTAMQAAHLWNLADYYGRPM